MPRATWQMNDHSFFFFFLRTLLLDTGRLLLPGWELASTPFAHPRPSETGEGYCRSAAVGRMRPAPLPGGLQLTHKSSSRATHIRSTEVCVACGDSCLQKHSPYQSPAGHIGCGPRNAVQQQRKRWKVRGNECNAPPPGGNRATNIVSGYTLPPRLCITHCRPGAIRSHHPRFVTVHNPALLPSRVP